MYKIKLGEKYLPILPENLKESIQMNNSRYDTFGVGERVLPGKQKLRSWSISSYFPFDFEESPTSFRAYYTGLIHREYEKGDHAPIKPISFCVTRELAQGQIIFDTNAQVLIESIEWEDRQGEPGDLYYTISLVEYKNFGTKVV